MKEFWEQYSNTGEKHDFTLKDGSEFLGWIIEVSDSAVLVMWAPSPLYGDDEMSPPDEWIPFTDIVLESLSYWDDQMRTWCRYPSGEIYRPPDVTVQEVEETIPQSKRPWWKFWSGN